MDGWKVGGTDGRTDGQTDRHSNGHRDTDTKKKENAIPTVASSLNQHELVDLDYKYYTPVAENFFSHDVGTRPKIRFCAFQTDKC